MTPEQIAQAMELRRLGFRGRMDWRKVAKAMKLSRRTVLKHCDPAAYEQECKWDRNHKNENLVRGNPSYLRDAKARVDVSLSVLEERDRALSAERDLTAMLCGDPLPGRSALDKRAA